MTEKLKHHPKSWPNIKKANDKKETLKNKKEFLKEQKNCNKETRKELTKTNIGNLKDNLWHKVKPWENLRKIIYNHAKETWKEPIKPWKLKGINITPWDKIYFGKDEVIVKYLWWWTKKIPFEMPTNNCKPETKKKQEITTPKPNITQEELDFEIKLWEINEKNLEKLEKEEKEAKEAKRMQEKKEQVKITETIFDKESPLLWDKIAYKHEIEVRKSYWDKITELVNKHCKWSIIDENFLYWVMARESRFDKKATSYTWVKWLWQLTSDTILTVANINEAKARKYPEHNDFYISDEIRTWVPPKKKKDIWHYKVNKLKAQNPVNQIKLTTSYLMYLEDLFSDVKDKNFKTELIITSYNLWPWKTKEIYDNYKWVKNWEWLKQALERAHNKWEISKEKLKEVVEYVPKVKEYIKIASLLNRKVA